ncbi:MAG: hypothetical protein ACTSWX_06130 [Promethearchaeota archaeon]
MARQPSEKKKQYKFFRDIEINGRDFFLLFLITLGSLLLSVINLYYIRDYLSILNQSLIGIAGISVAIITGLLIGGFIIDKKEKKYPYIIIIFTISPTITLIGYLLRNSNYYIIPFSINLTFIMIITIIQLTLFVKNTTTLERGRIIAAIMAIASFFTILTMILIGKGNWVIIPMLSPIVFALFFFLNRKSEKTITHFTILEEKEKIKTENTENTEKLIGLETLRKINKQRRAFKKFLKYFFSNRTLIKYIFVIGAMGIIIGLLIPFNQVVNVLGNIKLEQPVYEIWVFAPIFVAIAEFILGFVFDNYGRKTTISFIIFTVGIFNFLNFFQTGDKLNKIINSSLLISLIFCLLIIIPLINGDISREEFYGRTIVISLLSGLFGLLLGYFFREVVFLNFFIQYPFFRERFSEIFPNINENILYNFSISTLISFICLIGLFFLANIHSELTYEEQNWPDKLHHLYVIHNSGLLLYEYKFKEEEEILPSDLISGGFIGIITILKEISKKKLRAIDHGDKILLFQWDSKEEVAFVLVIEKELVVIRQKFSQFVMAFEKRFSKSLQNFAGVDVEKWKETKDLVDLFFSRKFMNLITGFKQILDIPR